MRRNITFQWKTKCFMKIMNDSVKLQEGHYILRLPFRKYDDTLPDNHHVAEQHLLNLQCKFNLFTLLHK
jgi:hypothetical protein